jgi:sodium/bile acid cotransporter 7
MMKRHPFIPDNYTLMLVVMVILASILPAQGIFADALKAVTTGVIGLLFFLHGAKLSRQAVFSGLAHWRLHLLIFSSTFVLFPALGLALKPILSPFVDEQLYIGILFLCMLPATVQSSIALTAIARGNVPAAVCSASGSTLIGIFITPFLVNWLVTSTGGASSQWDAVGRIMLQLMLPFLVGHLSRPLLLPLLQKSGSLVTLVDRSSILLVVYAAFSSAVIAGIWQQVSWPTLLGLVVVCVVLLTIALFLTGWAARRMKLSREDQITVAFCASQKSLASGIPMAQVLFTASTVGMMVLPLMLFHQIQLMACSVLAQRWAKSTDSTSENLSPAK